MTEKVYSFNDSFNEEFCSHLEYHLCRTFPNSDHKDISRFWCDGIYSASYFNEDVNREYLSPESVLKTKIISTTANTGISGQDYYEMNIYLGTKSLSNYEQNISLIDCIPSENSMEWISIDIEKQIIDLRLK